MYIRKHFYINLHDIVVCERKIFLHFDVISVYFLRLVLLSDVLAFGYVYSLVLKFRFTSSAVEVLSVEYDHHNINIYTGCIKKTLLLKSIQ